MTIRIQNSLTRKKEEFVPALPLDVKMYTCGVTVYDDCHVGHARSLCIFDCFKKYLQYRGFKVKLIRNITDVDDKIINRAKEEDVAFEEVRSRYLASYERDLKALEVEKGDFEPRASENVFYMVDHIRRLIAKGAAYAVDGDVYFSVRSFGPYGRLSGQGVDEMLTAVRIDKNEKKRDPLDFALWKRSQEGEPSWPSPWGPGRPGWHIECSTMSMRYLKTETLDIHAGGRDLIFPHHENEIAQAEALTGKPFARYWMHHGLLTIQGRKMSKSLGNFVTIQDVLKKYPADILKLFFLSAHYRSPMDFTYEALEKTKRGFEKIEEFIERADIEEARSTGAGELEANDRETIDKRQQAFESAMDDDFNTALALAALFDLVSIGNKFLSSHKTAAASYVRDGLRRLSGALGLSLQPLGKSLDISSQERVKVVDPAAAEALDQDEVVRLLEVRRQARSRKEFEKADEIRDYLKAHGIVLEDVRKVEP